MVKELKLLQKLNTRICHDLAGSISAIDNCINLLDNDDKSIRQKAKLLVTHESKNLVKKIKFYRDTYGMLEVEKEISIVYLTKQIKDFFENSKIEVIIHFDDGVIFIDSLVSKTLMCLVMVASEHICLSGTIDIFFGDDKINNLIKIVARGKVIRLKDNNMAILNGNNELSIEVSNCQEHYISALLNKSNYKISIIKKEESLEYYLNSK